MSGALSIGLGVAGILFGGSGPVTLGGLTFYDMEVPERIVSGGRQHVIVHRMPGGGRVVDAMGADDRPLEWTGFFRGSGAAGRARAFDAMRQAGKPVPLTWGPYTRLVVICLFECEYANGGFFLPYRISCEVVPAVLAAQPLGLLGELQSDLGSAVASVAQAADSILVPVASALAQVQSIMPLSGALVAGTGAFASIQGGVISAQSVTGAAALAGDTALTNAASSGGLVVGAGAANAASTLNSIAGASGVAALARRAAGYVNRMAANLTGAST